MIIPVSPIFLMTLLPFINNRENKLETTNTSFSQDQKDNEE